MGEFLTAKRFDELTKELEELKTTRRSEVAKSLRDAKELGDLSENSEYLEAREEQGRVEGRILELADTLKFASIIKEGSSKGVVGIGSTVEIISKGKNSKFIIVGTNEARPDKGFISNQSPLGKGLIGLKTGESVTISAPSGKIEYKVRKVS